MKKEYKKGHFPGQPYGFQRNYNHKIETYEDIKSKITEVATSETTAKCRGEMPYFARVVPDADKATKNSADQQVC